MSWVRIAALGILAAALLIAAVCTWGSLGSAVCCYCLIVMAAALLYQRFLNHRNEDDFIED